MTAKQLRPLGYAVLILCVGWCATARADHNLVERLPKDTAVVVSVDDVPGHVAMLAEYKIKDLGLPFPLPMELPVERITIGVAGNPMASVVLIELPEGKTLADLEKAVVKWMAEPPLKQTASFVDFGKHRQLRVPGLMVSPTFGEVRKGDTNLVAVAMMPVVLDKALAGKHEDMLSSQPAFAAAWKDLAARGVLKRRLVMHARGDYLRQLTPTHRLRGRGPQGRPQKRIEFMTKLVDGLTGLESLRDVAVGADLPGAPGTPIVVQKVVRYEEGVSGVPRFLLTCPKPPPVKGHGTLDTIPVGCDVAVRLRPGGGGGLLKLIDTVFAAVDEDIAREFDTELAELSKDAGVDIEKAILGAVANDVGVGFHFPSLRSDPELGVVAVLSDPKTFGAAIDKLIEFGGVEVDNRGGPGETVRVFKGRPLPITLATRESYFALATRPEVARYLGRALAGENRLVDSKAYKAVAEGLPVDGAVLWVCVDLGMILDMALGGDRPDPQVEPVALAAAVVLADKGTITVTAQLDRSLIKRLLAVAEVARVRMRR